METEEGTEFELCTVDKSDWYTTLMNKVKVEPHNYADFRIEKGALMKQIGNSTDITRTNWRMVVPNKRRQDILKECHDEAAHLGYSKTCARLCERYYWPRMFVDVKNYVKKCRQCLETKAPNYIVRTPMGKPRVPKVPWEVISADHKREYPRSASEHTHILVVTDSFSKFPLIHKVRKANAKSTFEFLENQVFLIFGVPKQIITDNGPEFKSRKFKALENKYGFEHVFTPRYHPQANPTERVNRVSGTAISAYVDDKHKKWDEKLPQIGYALRTCVHESTKYTPYDST